MRGCVKCLVNIVINHRFKFECSDSKDKTDVCKKLDNNLITLLSDLHDREWHHIVMKNNSKI